MDMDCVEGTSVLSERFCFYTTTRQAKVHNPRLAAAYYFTICLTFCYIIIYTIVVEKGYQISADAIGYSHVKVKGIAITNNFNVLASDPSNASYWDSLDLVDPPMENSAVFITTSYVVTLAQKRDVCAGNSDVDSCDDDSDCSIDYLNAYAPGVYTGQCSTNVSRCEVMGWCPLEDDSDPIVLQNLGNFTIYVQTDIRFDSFGVSRTNTLDKNGDGTPIYGYNLWTLDQIVLEATNNQYTADNLSYGAVILMDNEWNCNLDYSLSHCEPKFSFSRLDGATDSISSGFQYRKVRYDMSYETRNLIKQYGIRMIFHSSGVASKFSLSVLSTTFGAGLAYLALAKYVCDFILTSCVREKDIYAKAKIHEIGLPRSTDTTFQQVPTIRGKSFPSLRRLVDLKKERSTVQSQTPGAKPTETNGFDVDVDVDVDVADMEAPPAPSAFEAFHEDICTEIEAQPLKSELSGNVDNIVAQPGSDVGTDSDFDETVEQEAGEEENIVTTTQS